MSRHEIPARWMDAVRRHVLATRGEERDHLLVYDFSGTVRLHVPVEEEFELAGDG